MLKADVVKRSAEWKMGATHLHPPVKQKEESVAAWADTHQPAAAAEQTG